MISVYKMSTQIYFTIHLLNDIEKIDLYPEASDVPSYLPTFNPIDFDLKLLYIQFVFVIHLKECPLGFLFSVSQRDCLCLQSVTLELKCNYNDYSVQRATKYWLSAAFLHTQINQSYGVIIHSHCPYDYCRSDNDSLSVYLENPDMQCQFNHSGILCGACQSNLSSVLGSSKCKECSNLMVLALLPSVVLAGVLLVIFLTSFDLTVSKGWINGLIFYANIVRANHNIIFPPEISTSFMSTFITWLNLDLGFETCFYDGLTPYAKTWLQFAFPLYIWFMVIIIIVASHYSSTASRLSGSNAVQVLATLFLLSYAKIIRIIITAFSSTNLVYPNGFTSRV